MRYEYEETAPRRRLAGWMRLALAAGLTAGCAILVLPATSVPAAAMSADDCQKLPDDALLLAVDQGLCTLDVLPSAGPAPQIADKGTTGEHQGGNPGDGGNSGGSGGSGGGSGDGDGGGDDGGGDDGGDNGGDDGGSGGGDDGGGSGGDDGHGHDHDHGHGHGHGHGRGGCRGGGGE
jgi:hypothetical protein